jgi:hypothetical protein
MRPSALHELKQPELSAGRLNSMPELTRALALAAAMSQAISPARDPALEPLRAALHNPPPILVDTSGTTTRFRVTVEERGLRLPLPWLPDRAVANGVRPFRPLYHHEFLGEVTPDIFRSGVQYPTGVNVLSVLRALGNSLNRELRRREEQRIRKRIQEELRQLEAARKKKAPFLPDNP